MKHSNIIKISGAGHYNGEYPREKGKTLEQDLAEWEEMMRRVGKSDAVVRIGYFTFGKNDPEEGRFHETASRYLQDSK